MSSDAKPRAWSRCSWLGSYRHIVLSGLVVALLLAVLVFKGVVTSPFTINGSKSYEKSSFSVNEQDGCDCVWRISCAKYRWQVNFTSPRYNCGYEQLDNSAIGTCLRRRREETTRDTRLYITGYVREAFLVEYLQQRLGATLEQGSCRFSRTGPGQKSGDDSQIQYYQVDPPEGHDSCTMLYRTHGLLMEYKYVRLLSDDTFAYIDDVEKRCKQEGCAKDILIISAGAGELLESTLMDSFEGVRRFQREYKRLLPRLIQLVSDYHLEVVWKIHEPVTDELIPDGSMVRNDLLQEYNALIMEQTLLTPVQVWTSHMIMKLHHIEECSLFEDTTQLNSDPWRCEEEWVAGDHCHADYFDTIFNRICQNMVPMPENPCCSA